MIVADFRYHFLVDPKVAFYGTFPVRQRKTIIPHQWELCNCCCFQSRRTVAVHNQTLNDAYSVNHVNCWTP